MPRLFYLPLVQPGVLLSLKAAKKEGQAPRLPSKPRNRPATHHTGRQMHSNLSAALMLLQILFLCNSFLERLTCLERRQIGSGNDHRFARFGVTTLLLSACTNLKCAKANNLNLIALSKRIGNAVQHCRYGLIGILFGKIRLFGDCVYKLCLIHY